MIALHVFAGWVLIACAVGVLIGHCLRRCDVTGQAEPTDWDAHLSAWPSGDELIEADQPVDEWSQERIDAEAARLDTWL